jgi:mannose-6-phosphate isomerase-like protein (cupin superfamily)
VPGQPASFDRCNLVELQLDPVVAHDGRGTIGFHRILTNCSIDGKCNFMDYSVLPPGCSVGAHTHSSSEEEFYLILEGGGLMRRGAEAFRVRAGDLVRNPPGGTHSLLNDGTGDLRMFVFELCVPE